MRLAIDGQTVAFRIEEKQERTPHIPMPKELAEKASRDRWGYHRSNPWPKYDYSPCGQLSIVIDPDGYSNLRRTYADGKTQVLERMTGEIVVGVAAHAAATRERRIAAEESRRRATEAAERRQRIQAYEQREERRQTFVDLITEKLDERAKLSKVLAHVAAMGEADMPPGMAVWLKRHLAEVDAALSPRFVEIAARYVKIDFEEVRAAAGSAQPSWYYPRDMALELWSIDGAAGTATALSPLEWPEAEGLNPIRCRPSAAVGLTATRQERKFAGQRRADI